MWVPAPSCGWSGESKSRKGWDNNVKRRHGAALWPCQRVDQPEKFHNRTGPSVNQHQRYSVGAGRVLMDKMNLLSVNFRRELVEVVDPRFLGTPVILLLPVGREFADFLDIRSVFPGRAGKLIGPLGFRQTASKINENPVGNMCFERSNSSNYRLRLCQRSMMMFFPFKVLGVKLTATILEFAYLGGFRTRFLPLARASHDHQREGSQC